MSAVSSLLEEKIGLLKRLGDPLHLLSSHDALESYDHLLRSIVSDITNCHLDSSAWTQC